MTVTFLGMEYDEVLHFHNTTNNPKLRDFYGLVLRCLGWLHGLQEPERTSCLAGIIQSGWFEGLSATVIITNAFFMLFMVDDRMKHAVNGMGMNDTHLAEYIFVSIYTLEVVLKLAVHRLYFFVNEEMHWNILDFTLVFLALLDTVMNLLMSMDSIGFDATVLRSLRVLKMAKILRVLRVLRVFNDLRLMLRSVMFSCLSLFWSFTMLCFVYYLFGLVFVQSLTMKLVDLGNALDPTLKQDIADNFGAVWQTMLTLFFATTGGNDWQAYYAILDQVGSPSLAMLFAFFVGFVQISLMNILTAVFVEKALSLAQPDTSAQAKQTKEKELADARELRSMLTKMDTDRSGSVDADEFRLHIRSMEMQCCFKVLGLDVKNAEEFFEMLALASEGQDINIEAFVQGCLQMRGSATGITQQKLIIQAAMLFEAQKEFFHRFGQQLNSMSEQLRRVMQQPVPPQLPR